MSFELQILLALLLDALLGDPPRFPHPVRLIGRLARVTEKGTRKVIQSPKTAGMCTVLLVLALTGIAGWGLITAAGTWHPVAGNTVSVLLLYFCFAARDLFDHSRKVAEALQCSDLAGAREKVGMIVGRDTVELEREGVITACVESVAENTVDGITAPIFWAVIGGPIGALLYKGVNTMDSMFGYTNKEYYHFGWAAARLDDLLNWLPARVTGLMMVIASFFLAMRPAEAWRIFLRDRLQHASPNSGHPEAAVAGALGIRLGGRSMYFGRPVCKPLIGDDFYPPAVDHIKKTNVLMIGTTVLTILFLIGAKLAVQWVM